MVSLSENVNRWVFMYSSVLVEYMSETVNMYADPNRDSNTRVFTLEGPSVDEEALTSEVTDRVDLDAYLDRHYETGDTASGFIGTVSVGDSGNVETVRIATQVHENPIA